MRASSDLHPFACGCGECDVHAIVDETLPLRMTMIGLLISGVIIAISETIRHFDAIASAVLS